MSPRRALLFALLCGFAASPGGTRAQTPAPTVNVLALGEQSHPDSVPRDNRIHARVVTALNDAMIRSGVAVFDETAVTASFTSQDRTLRSDAEVIDIARAVPAPPLDAVLVFEIQATARRQRPERAWYTPRVVITGRILHLQTGRLFARIEAGAGTALPDIPPDCARSRPCFIDALGDQARPLATDLAAALMRQLATFTTAPRPPAPAPAATPGPAAGVPPPPPACGDRRQVTVELSGYRPADVTRVERYLSVLRCRLGHRVDVAGPNPLVTYETGLDLPALQAELAASTALWSPPGTVAAVDGRLVVTAGR